VAPKTIPGTIVPGSMQSAAPDLPEAQGQDRFEDMGQIGEGGMSTVRQVRDRNLLRTLALKILEPEHAASAGWRQRFIEEAQITGQLEHPGIVPIHDLRTEEDGSVSLYMKLVRGIRLDQAIMEAGDQRLNPSKLAEFLQIFLKVCDAVAFAHSHGVLHRDLKPSNIMVGDFGQVYVLDWGVARLARRDPLPADDEKNRSVRISRPAGLELDARGSLIGTPSFMAPEQVELDLDQLDERCDIFGLGAILYAIVTAEPPFQGSTINEVINSARLGVFLTPSESCGGRVPPGLEQIILKAMAHDPRNRHGSVSELEREVESFLHGAWDVPTRAFPAGAMIVNQGESGDAAYLITKGRCRVLRLSGSEVILVAELGPGEVFGEAAVFSDMPRTASVLAADDVEVMVVTKEYLTQAVGLNSWVGPFVKALAQRFHEVESQWRELEQSIKSSRKRK
jgi:serine/threonine-protein kinase